MLRPAVGWLGLPVQTDLGRLEADVAIVGVPHGWPYPRPGATAGCAEAPSAVRAASRRFARFRGNHDFDLGAPWLPVTSGARLVDVGDVPGDPTDGPGNAARTGDAVAQILARGAVPVCIGGDDSVPIPILRAFQGRGPLTVLQVDAHLDFRDEVDGVREGYSSPMRRASEMAHVDRIVQVGLRGVGSARPEDVEEARAGGNRLVTARDLRQRGVEGAVDELPADGPIFLSFDCDALEPAIFPAVSALAPGGLSYDQATDLLKVIGPRLAGAVFTEYVPALDSNGACGSVLVRMLATLISGLTRELPSLRPRRS